MALVSAGPISFPARLPFLPHGTFSIADPAAALIGFPASDPAPAGRRCHRYAVGRNAAGRYVYELNTNNDMQTKTKEETKQDAIREWVAREFNAVPQEWVRIAMEHFGYWEPLPMWGTMWM